jgi:hypothetical protein
MRYLTGSLAASAAIAGAAEAQNMVSVFAGQQVADGWQDVFIHPGNLDWQDSGVAGIAVGREWPVWGHVSLGFEAQVVQHFGEQDHAEFNLPLTARYATGRLAPLRSLAGGMGVSYATEIPPIEAETRDGSEQTLLYWMLEAEFGLPTPEATIYARLHHRSNGYGVVAEEGGSNVLVIGLRHRW